MCDVCALLLNRIHDDVCLLCVHLRYIVHTSQNFELGKPKDRETGRCAYLCDASRFFCPTKRDNLHKAISTITAGKPCSPVTVSSTLHKPPGRDTLGMCGLVHLPRNDVEITVVQKANDYFYHHNYALGAPRTWQHGLRIYICMDNRDKSVFFFIKAAEGGLLQ